jgi:riboflavin kinase
VEDILAVDVSPAMLGAGLARHNAASPTSLSGNAPALRAWTGDIESVPTYQGPVDAVFFNSVFGNVHDQRGALDAASGLARPGGRVVLSHPLGRAWHGRLRAADPEAVPHALPDADALDALIAGLPLRVVSLIDEADCYAAVLEVPPGFALPAPLLLEAPVVAGFGRGSRQLGTPTANLPPDQVVGAFGPAGPSLGVYFGWARLLDPDPEGSAPADAAPYPAVLNVGRRPTFEGQAGGDLTVEVHVLHRYAADFYGRPLRVAVGGFLRPERRFAGGVPALVAQIAADIGMARAALGGPEHAGLRGMVE